jgi:hypothetical protein
MTLGSRELHERTPQFSRVVTAPGLLGRRTRFEHRDGRTVTFGRAEKHDQVRACCVGCRAQLFCRHEGAHSGENDPVAAGLKLLREKVGNATSLCGRSYACCFRKSQHCQHGVVASSPCRSYRSYHASYR